MPLPADQLVEVGSVLVFVLVGVGIAYAGYRELQPEIDRRRSDPLDVRDAPKSEGLTELRGTVEPIEHVMKAPFTETECVVYEFDAEEYVSSGKNSHWESLASGDHRIPFRLRDDTGSILIEPDGAECALSSGWEAEFGAEKSAGGRIAEFLRSLDVEPGEGSEFSVGPLSVGTGDRRRYSEERLDVGETVSVFGPVAYDPSAGGDWGSDEVDAAVRANGTDPFVVADSPAVPTIRRGTLVGGGLAGFGLLIVAVGCWALVTALISGAA